PMRDIPVACSAGKVDGQVVLDLCKEEDNYGEADMPVAIAPRKKEILLLQMDGHLTPQEFDEALELAIKGCEIVSKLQKEALLEKYIKEVGRENE
ncbi:MAG TPA: exosome complex exonuclease Rrp41, partial [Thermoplasmatales archaeon]|nr:exosome complex exonuclease Rrp41 [Thermoplasmatales archaeon]